MTEQRKIIHIDMDAFYASVEQRDNPELRTRPVAVGGDPKGRGVVAAASYEARAFGVHSAMPSAEALRRCPELVFVPPRISHYREVSARIHAIFRAYTDLIEPLSLDEAYLDVTRHKSQHQYASQIANEIRGKIASDLALSASAGVAPVKFLAKIASDMHKPNGLTVIQPHEIPALMERLEVGKIPGIGAKTQEKMHAMGVRTTGDLQQFSRVELQQKFGKSGGYYYDICRGIDPRPVRASRVRKSYGSERTFAQNHEDSEWIFEELQRQSQQLLETLATRNKPPRTATIKVRYPDFVTVTRSFSSQTHTLDVAYWRDAIRALLAKTDASKKGVRLLGISYSNFESDSGPQQELGL